MDFSEQDQSDMRNQENNPESVANKSKVPGQAQSTTEPLHSYLREDELRRLLNQIPSRSNYWYITLAITCTGARVTEILELRVRDVDFTNRVITIGQTKTKQLNMGQRQIPMAESLEKELSRYLKTLQEPRNEDDKFFKVSSDSLYRVLRQAGQDANVHLPVTPQILRLSFVNTLLEQGCNPHIIARLMGALYQPHLLHIDNKVEGRRG